MVELLPVMIREMARRESNYFSEGKISLPQLSALQFLIKNNGCPMNQLAEHLNISRPAVTGLVDRLRNQTLVRREAGLKDRRVTHLYATAKAKQIVTHIWRQKRSTILHIFERISPLDRAHYLKTLEQVVEILSQRPRR